MQTEVNPGGSAGETVGERLRRLRTERRLSQGELSERGDSNGRGRWREASQACRAWAKMLRKAGRESEALDVLARAADLAGRRESTEVHASR